MFTFDMPRNASPSEKEEPKREQPEARQEENIQSPKEEKIVHRLTEEMEEPVKKELSSQVKNTHNGVTRYSLDDYMQVEEMLKNSHPVAKQ
ncbi:cell division protein FtsZ, partial [Salinimicrobium sp. CDJ15-91]|nr:cell division protein FtsZ [Salinimicrobium oceani]